MSASAAAPPPTEPRRRRRWPWIVLAVVLALAALAGGAAYWLLFTESGARTALDKAAGMLGPNTRIEGVKGRLGGKLHVDRVHVDRPGLQAEVHGLDIDTAPLDPLHPRLDIRDLRADRIDVLTAPSSGEAPKEPQSLAPPVPVHLENAHIGSLHIGKIAPGEAATKPRAPAKRPTPEVKAPAAKPEASAPAASDVEAAANDLQHRLAAAAGPGEQVLRNIVVSGSGDENGWHIEHASADTEYGKVTVSGDVGAKRPFPLDMKARLEGAFQDKPLHVEARLGGSLEHLAVNGDVALGETHASAEAKLQPFSKQPLRSLAVNAKEVDLSRFASGVPATRLAVEARLQPEGESFTGPVRVENPDPGPWDRGKLPFTRAHARVTLGGGGPVRLADLGVSLAGGGTLQGTASVGADGAKAELRVSGVDLAALDTTLQKTDLSGTVSVTGDRSAQRFELALEDPAFRIEGRGALANRHLDVRTVRVGTEGGAVVAHGGLDLAGDRAFQVQGHAEHFDPSAFARTAKGDLNFDFTAAGTLAGGLSGQADIRLAPSRYAGLPASGRIAVAGDTRRLDRADVHVALGGTRVDATGGFGAPGKALDVKVHSPNLSAIAAPLGVALAGRLDATAHLTGTWSAPAGRITAEGQNLALPGGVRFAQARLQARAGTEPTSPLELAFHATGVTLGKAQPPEPFARALDLTVRGTRAEHRLVVEAQMTKDARLRATLAGGLDERATPLAWKGRIEALTLTGRGAFSLVAPTPLYASAERVQTGQATLRGTWGQAHLAQLRWTPETLDFSGSTSGVQIQNVARSLRLGPVPRSTLVLAGHWEVHAAREFNATLDLHRTSGDLRVGEPALALGLAELALRLDVRDGRAQASLVAAGERIGRIEGRGTSRIVRGPKGWTVSRAAPLEARLDARVPDVGAFAGWLGAGAELGGRVDAHVNASGTVGDPRLQGTIAATRLAVREPQSGFELADGEVSLRLDGQQLAIERLSGRTPWDPSQRARAKLGSAADTKSGTVRAQGAIDLAQRRGAIRIRLDHAAVTQLPGRFVALSGEARLESAGQGIEATGDLRTDAGWIGALESAPPSVSDDVVVIRPAQPAQPAKSKERIRVDLRLALGDRFYFQGRGLDTRLTGEIHVVGEPIQGLRATGTIRTVDGTYKGYGQNLAIEHGVLKFVGPLDNPELNVRALRKGLPVEAGVDVLGTVARPHVRLVSIPEVPEPEKLSWLVLGRAPSDLTASDASLLVTAAASMLGHEPGQGFAQKLGLDEVKIGRSSTANVLGVLPETTVAGRTGQPGAAEVVTVGKQLNDRLKVSYEQGLAAAEGTLTLAWDISKRFEVLVRGGYLPGADAVWRWAFP